MNLTHKCVSCRKNKTKKKTVLGTKSCINKSPEDHHAGLFPVPWWVKLEKGSALQAFPDAVHPSELVPVRRQEDNSSSWPQLIV